MSKLKSRIFIPTLLFGLTLANFASAALVNCGQAGKTACTIPDLFTTIVRLINFLLSWAWIVAIFFIMWAGYDMMFSGGNSESLQSAKDKFKHAIIGFILIMVSYLLINWIVGLFTGQIDSQTGGVTPQAGSFDFFRHLITPF